MGMKLKSDKKKFAQMVDEHLLINNKEMQETHSNYFGSKKCNTTLRLAEIAK